MYMHIYIVEGTGLSCIVFTIWSLLTACHWCHLTYSSVPCIPINGSFDLEARYDSSSNWGFGGRTTYLQCLNFHQEAHNV